MLVNRLLSTICDYIVGTRWFGLGVAAGAVGFVIYKTRGAGKRKDDVKVAKNWEVSPLSLLYL